jgi:AraC family transcriptional regulator of adaptative response/methylated-DNA-[protein]-cysteine methyltransferase
MSPFHFQRIFTEWAGLSPKKFLQFLTTEALRAKLKETSSISEAADAVGLSGQSRVYDLFTGIEAVTPGEYKSGGKDLKIAYGHHSTPFGECFLAITEKGICGMAFLNASEREAEFESFKRKWHFANLKPDQHLTGQYVERIFGTPAVPLPPLHLLVQGTNFQVKVWEALLRIPEGALTTYKHIAETIGNPKAVRAVGTAVGDNPIAYLIPCHRVIRGEGKLGEYRWGSNRKKLMIGWEASRIIL